MIDKNKVSGAEMQCKVHRGAEVQKYVQMFSRGDCAGDYADAETRCNMQRWCRECADAEVQMQRCRCRGAEVQRLCRGVGAEQVCRVCAEVQSICKGSGEVIVQAIVQRCQYGGAATYTCRGAGDCSGTVVVQQRC